MSHRLLVVALALLAAPLRADVLVVDSAGGPGSDFTSLQAAADAAADGDVLLVRDGAYGGLLIDGKSLAVVADSGAKVYLAFSGTNQQTEIRNLAASQHVLLAGLDLRSIPVGPPFLPGVTCAVHDCDGTVWFDECIVEQGSPSLRVQDAARVIVAGSTVAGSLSVDAAAGTGLVVVDSHVALEGCAISGGHGKDSHAGAFGLLFAATAGGTALDVQGDSHVTASACTVAGGDGGSGFSNVLFCEPPQDGGTGLRLLGADSGVPAVALAQTAPVGGAPGSFAGCGRVAHAGLDQDVQAGVAGVLFVQPPVLTGGSPVREGGLATLHVQGQAGALGWLLLSPVAGGAFLPGKGGELLLGGPILVLPLGALPPVGALTLSGHVPELGPGVDGLVVYAQAASCGAGCALGTGSALLLLDAAF